MYVLIDMEWVTNNDGEHWPTQLAAMRVNENWEAADTFTSLIRPRDRSFWLWDHMAFTGWDRADFQNARDAFSALSDFWRWLMPDDILCWWHREANDLFNIITKDIQTEASTTKTIILGDYIYGLLGGGGGSPYRLCATLGLKVPKPAHCSPKDVLAMQSLVRGIGFSQCDLLRPPKGIAKGMTALKGTADFPLLYDPGAKLLHMSDCAALPDNRYLPAFTSYQAPIRHRYKPCVCCRNTYNAALRERNRDSISRSDYNYVFSGQSRTFHRKDCPYVLSSFDIQGAGLYKTCIKGGRRPCKYCNPVPAESRAVCQPKKTVAPKQKGKRKLTEEERDAIGRFHRAKEERKAALKRGNLTEAEREVVMTLTQPGYAFWAGRGYRTFHRRNCSQLTGLTQIRGFPRYQDAVQSGYSPCRHCKPSPRQDILFSIPITNEEREGETVETLIWLCTEHCLKYQYDDRYFTMETTVGKWRIDMGMRPVHLEHINRIMEPGNVDKFHVQPRLFLSLKDTFDYIVQHDNRLIKEY